MYGFENKLVRKDGNVEERGGETLLDGKFITVVHHDRQHFL